MNNGQINKRKTVVVPATNEVIQVTYTIGYSGSTYRVENDNDLFRVLNYAMQQKHRLMRGNIQGLKDINYGELRYALRGTLFKAKPYIKEDGTLNIEPCEDLYDLRG